MAIDPLPSWRETTAKQSILDFLAAVTEPASPAFVPVADRVAVFDNDGTMATEMPMYTQLAFALDRAAELGQPTSLDELKAGGLAAVFDLVMLTHASISTDDFNAVGRQWIATAQHPRSGQPYPSMVYQPMLELLALLDSHAFACWIVSGGGVDFMRTWAGEVYGLPAHRLIGSAGSVELQATDAGPQLMKGPDVHILDDGAEKPVSIHRHIGQRPLLAAGNTNGDLAMLEWTAANPYRTLQLVVHHTDGDREYAYDEDPLLGAGTDQVLAAASAGAWTVIDMAADWSEIFPTLH